MDLLLQELRDNQVDQFTPEEYAAVEAEVARVKDLFDSGLLADGSGCRRCRDPSDAEPA